MKQHGLTVRKLWPLAFIAGCWTYDKPTGTDLNGEGDTAGIPELNQNLTNPFTGGSGVAATCVLNTTTKILTYTFGSGELVVLVSQNSGKVLTFNGFTNVTKLVMTGTAANETVILDYLGAGGNILPGSATAVGMAIDLGAGTNQFKMRGTAAADTWVLGAGGLSTKTATVKDLTFVATGGTVAYTASLGAGADNFSAAGNATVGAAFATAVTVFGGDGADTLRGGAGNDTLNGGNDNDTFNAGTAADGADTFIGGTGNTFSGTGAAPAEADTVDYSGRTNAVLAKNDMDPTVAASSTNGTKSGEQVTAAIGDEGDLIANDIEIIKGGAGDDLLAAGSNPTQLVGNAGNNTFTTGSAGQTTMTGGAGNDTFKMGVGAAAILKDVIVGGAGTDTVDFSFHTTSCTINLGAGSTGIATTGNTQDSGEVPGTDKVTIGADVENAIGCSGGNTIAGNGSDNVLTGGAGADTINGFAGNDTIAGLGGNDILNGGDGDDTFDEGTVTFDIPLHKAADGTTDVVDVPASTGQNGSDTIDGGNGNDTVDYSLRVAATDADTNGTAVSVTLGAVGTTGINGVAGAASGGNVTAVLGDEGDTIKNTENAKTGDGADTINGNATGNTLEGGAGVDTIKGFAGDDIIDGGAGADIIDCGTGDGDINLDRNADSDDCGLTTDQPCYTNCEL